MSPEIPERVDVVVVGAGNAALCAALTAAEREASVVVLERAPRNRRGGNGVFTGGFLRFAFEGLEDLTAVARLTPDELARIDVGRYGPEDFLETIAEITDYRTDVDLADVLVSGSNETVRWLASLGVPMLPAFAFNPVGEDGRVRMHGHGPLVEVSGGGAGLIEALYRRVEAAGIPVLYDTRAVALRTDELGDVIGVTCRRGRVEHGIAAGAVVLASGGFEGSPELRARYLGSNWDAARVRGTNYNTGDGITMAMAVGADAVGNWTGCHASPLDINAPLYGDPKTPDIFIRRSYHLGIMVNRDGRRFLDEGQDFEANTYSKYGRDILQQPGQIAFQLFDAQTSGMLRSEYGLRQATRIQASTLEELAEEAGIDARQLLATVEEFNASVSDDEFVPRIKDGKSAAVAPRKSNWAVPLTQPPFVAYPVTCGITFTFGGIRVDENAQVVHQEGYPIGGLFAAGELIGGLFWGNYPAGTGIVSGSVFGRTAGGSAAAEALARRSK